MSLLLALPRGDTSALSMLLLNMASTDADHSFTAHVAS